MKIFPKDNNYLVDTEGNIFSKKRLHQKPYRLKYHRDISGKYYRASIGDRAYLVHRMVAITYLPNPLNLPQVNHIDGDKLNNNLSNLEWVTVGENQLHAYETGLKIKPKGILNGRQELTEKDVLEIYNSLLSGESNEMLANKYGVSSTQIVRIKSKHQWVHLTEDLPDILIKTKRKNLTEKEVSSLKACLSSKKTYKEAKELVNFTFSQHQYYDIKRRKHTFN